MSYLSWFENTPIIRIFLFSLVLGEHKKLISVYKKRVNALYTCKCTYLTYLEYIYVSGAHKIGLKINSIKNA